MHFKLNSLLDILESLGVNKVKQFKKCTRTVLWDLLLLETKWQMFCCLRSKNRHLGQSIQEWTKWNLWKTAFKKFPFLITLSHFSFTNRWRSRHFKYCNIQYYNQERGEAHTTFVNSTGLLSLSENNSADPETIHFGLINMFSNLQLESICRRIVWVCLIILWNWRVKGQIDHNLELLKQRNWWRTESLKKRPVLNKKRKE